MNTQVLNESNILMFIPWMFTLVLMECLWLQKATASSLDLLTLNWRQFCWHQTTKSWISSLLSVLCIIGKTQKTDRISTELWALIDSLISVGITTSTQTTPLGTDLYCMCNKVSPILGSAYKENCTVYPRAFLVIYVVLSDLKQPGVKVPGDLIYS